MSAIVIRMPVVPRPNFDSADWREQFEREFAATRAAMTGPAPPRTRPILLPSPARMEICS